MALRSRRQTLGDQAGAIFQHARSGVTGQSPRWRHTVHVRAGSAKPLGDRATGGVDGAAGDSEHSAILAAAQKLLETVCARDRGDLMICDL
jgi:hypothetical protein